MTSSSLKQPRRRLASALITRRRHAKPAEELSLLDSLAGIQPSCKLNQDWGNDGPSCGQNGH